jgi:hypothetical protein
MGNKGWVFGFVRVWGISSAVFFFLSFSCFLSFSNLFSFFFSVSLFPFRVLLLFELIFFFTLSLLALMHCFALRGVPGESKKSLGFFFFLFCFAKWRGNSVVRSLSFIIHLTYPFFFILLTSLFRGVFVFLFFAQVSFSLFLLRLLFLLRGLFVGSARGL